MSVQFLELLDHIGIEPEHYHDPETGEVKEHPNAGEPGPLVEEACAYAVPTMMEDGEIANTTRHVKIRPSEHAISKEPKAIAINEEVASNARIIPGTRQIETSDAELVNVLQQAGYKLVDPPKSQHVARGRGAKGEEADKS